MAEHPEVKEGVEEAKGHAPPRRRNIYRPIPSRLYQALLSRAPSTMKIRATGPGGPKAKAERKAARKAKRKAKKATKKQKKKKIKTKGAKGTSGTVEVG